MAAALGGGAPTLDLIYLKTRQNPKPRITLSRLQEEIHGRGSQLQNRRSCQGRSSCSAKVPAAAAAEGASRRCACRAVQASAPDPMLEDVENAEEKSGFREGKLENGPARAVGQAVVGSVVYDERQEELVGSLCRDPNGGASNLAKAGRLGSLPYLPYMAHQWHRFLGKMEGLRDIPLKRSLSWNEGLQGRKTARIESWQFTTRRLRRVRLTYFDAGEAGQAFNSMCYPDTSLDLPMLGVDLLAFGPQKVLCVLDFQPLSQDPDYLEKHTHRLAGVFSKFSGLNTYLSDRHFEQRFFSPYIMLFRSSKGTSDQLLQVPEGQFFQAFHSYLELYFDLVESATPDHDPLKCRQVEEQQSANDGHLAERDPANKLLDGYFGEEWSAKYNSEFLFTLAPPRGPKLVSL